jgi:hypothetical protein
MSSIPLFPIGSRHFPDLPPRKAAGRGSIRELRTNPENVSTKSKEGKAFQKIKVHTRVLQKLLVLTVEQLRTY